MGDGQEKTEASTQKHRQDARRKGTVAKSIDLVNACVILALLLVLPIGAGSIGQAALLVTSTGLSQIPMEASQGAVSAFAIATLRPMLPGMAMIFFTVMAVGVAVNFAQVGFVLSGEAIIPNFGKLNPMTGIQRMFSRRSAFETFKAVGKLGVFSLIAYGCVKSSWPILTSLDRTTPAEAIGLVSGEVRTLATRIAMAWAFLAALDYFFQRYQTDQQLRMTKEEVKREMKEAETSAEVKTARNIRRRRLMRQRLKQAVRSADVVVTNPTHYAVALRYEPGKSHAPIVVAKGVDYLAARIREEAAEAGVPLVPNAPLARALYKQCEIGDFVPRELFQAVAEVLAYVYRTLKRVRA